MDSSTLPADDKLKELALAVARSYADFQATVPAVKAALKVEDLARGSFSAAKMREEHFLEYRGRSRESYLESDSRIAPVKEAWSEASRASLKASVPSTITGNAYYTAKTGLLSHATSLLRDALGDKAPQLERRLPVLLNHMVAEVAAAHGIAVPENGAYFDVAVKRRASRR